MGARNRLGVALPCLLAAAAGCGEYTIVFEVEKVINTDANDPMNDATSRQLSVDIVCLTPQYVEELPEIKNGTMYADKWFELRDRSDPKIHNVIQKKHIRALRESGNKPDSYEGPPLTEGSTRGGPPPWETRVKFKLPNALSSKAAIVIYGRFRKGDGVADVPPLVISPPPKWNTELRILVGRGAMTWIRDE